MKSDTDIINEAADRHRIVTPVQEHTPLGLSFVLECMALVRRDEAAKRKKPNPPVHPGIKNPGRPC